MMPGRLFYVFAMRLGVVGCILAGIAGAMALPARGATNTPNQADWAFFHDRFLTTDGRIIDNGNGGVTHSEGQGYGMLLAAYYGDRASFDLIRDWTEKNLRRPHDHLHAWRYDPQAEVPVADPNNATDGDIFIAFALARAGERWHEPAYTAAAIGIASDILRLCVVDFNGRSIMLPGVRGFKRPEGYVLNLSYYAFAQMNGLSKVLPDPLWAKVQQDGLAIMRGAHFGPYALPPDWVLVTQDGKYRPADGWPARFSYDAVRIPLNLAWVRLREPALKAVVTMWSSSDLPVHPPAWVSLNGRESAGYEMGPGAKAIMQVSQAELKGVEASGLPAVGEAADYYQAALVLLAKMAVADVASGFALSEPIPAPQPVKQASAGESWLAFIGIAQAANADSTADDMTPSPTPSPTPAIKAATQQAFPDLAPFARPNRSE